MKIGVLGGGQLGLMLAQSPEEKELYFLESSIDCPVGSINQLITIGDFKNYDDVINFGQSKDIISIEIENVNTKALAKLRDQGKFVFPQPHIIEIIKDKGLQKKFYKQHNIPTSDFLLLDTKMDILHALDKEEITLPFVQKLRTGGYDGKGVQVVRSVNDLQKLFDAPSVVEKLVQIEKEIAIVAVRNPQGQIKTFPSVEMVFDPKKNLIDYQFSPAELDEVKHSKAIEVALLLTEKLGIVGLLAIEMFIDQKGDILINEVAPRPHNSGHHTIEACNFSQYDMHLRAIQGKQLENIQSSHHAAMINLVGSGKTGIAQYQGIEKYENSNDIFVHLYNKSISKSGRKMGHITILGQNREDLQSKITQVRSTVTVFGK